MLKILHRIVCMTGKYSSRIRASYLTSFIKGIMMKAPLIFSFFAISLFMKGQMNEKICLYLGIGLVICIAVEAVFEHITNVLQSATGYETRRSSPETSYGILYRRKYGKNKHGSMYRHGIY